jgi:hypothetical protein
MGRETLFMKKGKDGNLLSLLFGNSTIRALAVAILALSATCCNAQVVLGGSDGYWTNVLETWSFTDNTNWTDDDGYAPVSFTNLNYSYLGNGLSLVEDTNIPAWLQYNVVENDGSTNLTVDTGTIMFWFAPSSWSSSCDTNGGSGPGEFGRLLEAGAYTPDSSFGWWSLYVDDVGNNIYFSAQTNDLSSNVTTFLSAPIDWTTNYFHFIALTYSVTNTALYLDGALVTNGLPLSVYPGTDVLSNGFFIGSDSNGVLQAHGQFNDLYTFNTALDAGTIAAIFNKECGIYSLNPYNQAMFNANVVGGGSSTFVTPDVITGQGNLMLTNLTDDHVLGQSLNQVWITNMTARVAVDGTMSVTFTIEGGRPGFYYDVFVGTVLTSPLGNGNWSWQGQGQRRQQCTLTGLPPGTLFFILGTPQDTDGDGLTDAYELLVSHTNPQVSDTDGDGIPDGWEVFLGMNPLLNDNATISYRANYGYTPADWLSSVTGIKSGSVTTDNEGNVTSVSQ